MRTTLFYADVTPLTDPACYEAACRRISRERREKADRYRMEKDRRLCVGAGLLLKYALGDDPGVIETGPYGKPYIKDSPVHFNLSHSGSYAACVVSEVECGCDIEKITKADMRVAERFFCPDERAYLRAAESEGERDMRFFRLWTLRESFIKATGRGMSLPLNSFAILFGDCVNVRQSVDDRHYSFAEFDGIPGYGCAVCVVDGEKHDVAFTKLDILACI